ncbi:hypothetical protein [Klebsiella pneumoniae]|uniref:hypothetical protein n=1 Tax=Klebsiella pneumoniae TaxID=573 RepID=UPI0020CBC172|nr:hypothetical protein [Klebsiella pneumoniae]MCQ0898546.1 hypothetical protein [Klebsiella pneumoniae]
MSRRIRLTDAQVYTLRKIKNGITALLRGDGSRGDIDNGGRIVNCPSLPVLFREGLVDFRSEGKQLSHSWYYVKLTPDGIKAAIGAQTREERGL